MGRATLPQFRRRNYTSAATMTESEVVQSFEPFLPPGQLPQKGIGSERRGPESRLAARGVLFPLA